MSVVVFLVAALHVLIAFVFHCSRSSADGVVSVIPCAALLAENFLETTASQLTTHGLDQLRKTMRDGELAVFFRNNHFSTIYRYQVSLYAHAQPNQRGGTHLCAWRHFFTGHFETIHSVIFVFELRSMPSVCSCTSTVNCHIYCTYRVSGIYLLLVFFFL